MTEIYLIRHTQAEGNIYRMMQGHWDGFVTESGLKQIDFLAERFRGVHLDAVYSSDLSRAVITAKGVTRYNGLPIRTDSRLREIDVGPWTRCFFGNCEWENPTQSDYFMFDSEKWQIEGAETFNDVKERGYDALADIASRHDGETIAVVSHGVTIRCILAKIKGAPLTDVYTVPICKNTAVSKLIFEDGAFTAEYINDYSHVGKLGTAPWFDTADLRDEPFQAADDPGYYQRCYADAWSFAHHGDLTGFDGALCRQRSADHLLFRLFDKEKSVGLVELDAKRGAAEGYGWISLLYLCEEYRGKGYGVQALARAIMAFRDLGLPTIRLNVADENEAARRFYEKQGFRTLSDDGRLLLLEKDYGRIEYA